MPDRFDLVIVGMGSGGMIAAEFAATIGVTTAVVERDRIGGDCLWTGCVPSKALLASAKAAHYMRNGDHYGLPALEPDIDTRLVWARIHRIQEEIAATDDNPTRFEEMGVEVVRGEARIVGPHTVVVGDRTLEGRFILLCTGSRPTVPPIQGLEKAGFVTSETVWGLDRLPVSVVFIGGGPIAVELAQGFSRLGIAATILQKGPRLLPRDEPDLVAILTDRIAGEGVTVHTSVDVRQVTVKGRRKIVHGVVEGRTQEWSAEELFVATGRTPTIAGLGLEDADVALGPRGVEVDGRLRSSVPSIYAAGDVAGHHLFTHSAGHEAVQAVRDMFFPGRGRAPDLVPWCTFTDPELAHVGLTVAEAQARYGADDVATWRHDLAHSDRARTDGATDGAVVVVTAKKRIVGAHILAPAAGEMIHELALAMRQGLKLTDLAGMVHVYPTLALAVGQLASEAAYERAERLRWLVRKGR